MFRTSRVSIHAFREGRRLSPLVARFVFLVVSIHAFREGRRLLRQRVISALLEFQSTPSAREGDAEDAAQYASEIGFNPRLPRGKATLSLFQDRQHFPSFNPRLPRGKATCATIVELALCFVFQSTPSAREGDVAQFSQTSGQPVSIHAFREGRRRNIPKLKIFTSAVSIHAFREGRRPARASSTFGACGFQSTPSAREGDLASVTGHTLHRLFQSTPSAREGDTGNTRIRIFG